MKRVKTGENQLTIYSFYDMLYRAIKCYMMINDAIYCNMMVRCVMGYDAYGFGYDGFYALKC